MLTQTAPERSTAGVGRRWPPMWREEPERWEIARLQRQAEEVAPESLVLPERTALGPGQQAIDVGPPVRPRPRPRPARRQ